MTSVELRLSTSVRVLAVGAPLVLVALGLYGVLRGGLVSPGGVVAVVGVLIGVAAAWELPWSTEIGDDGVRRRALLRQRHVGWDDVVAFERHRRRPDGALVLRTIERERVVLADVTEPPAAWDRIREIVTTCAPGAAFPDPPPTHPFHRS